MYQKTHDYILTWTPNGQLCAAICKVKIFRDKKPFSLAKLMIFVSEMPNNPGMSVTNGFEQIANEILCRYIEEGGDNLEFIAITWIEHWAKDSKLRLVETFDRVQMRAENDRFCRPQWHRLSWDLLKRILEIEGEFKDA
jgi:hypothetical protein